MNSQKQIIANLPLSKIKKILVAGIHDFYSYRKIATLLNISGWDAKKLLKKLEELGYVSYVEKMEVWTNTLKGDLLANQRLKRTLTHEQAESRVFEVVDRIKILNKEDYFLHTVEEAFVYGDFLNQDLGELFQINIAVRLKQKEMNEKEYKVRRNKICREAEVQFSNYVEYLFYPEFLVFQYLKAKTHNLLVCNINSAHCFDRLPSKLVYKED